MITNLILPTNLQICMDINAYLANTDIVMVSVDHSRLWMTVFV